MGFGPAQGDVNTTAAITNASQFVQSNATVAGTNISGTIASNGMSLSAASAGGGVRYSNVWIPRFEDNLEIGNIGAIATRMQFFPHQVGQSITATAANFYLSVSVSTSSNSSHAGTLSIGLGIYTRNVSTLSLASSGSTNYQWTNTSDNSTSVLNAVRQFSVPINVNMTPGEYWFLHMQSTSSANANWISFTNFFGQMYSLGPAYSGPFLAASNVTYQMIPGFGTAGTAGWGLPNSIAINAISGGGANLDRYRPFELCNITF